MKEPNRQNVIACVPQDLVDKVHALIRAKTGDDHPRVLSFETLLGHAGFSWACTVDRTDGGAPFGKMLVRIAPPGVRISGRADIVRQAKVMASLGGTSVPVPPIYWYGDEPEFFGRPYLVEGFKLHDCDLPPEQTTWPGRRAIEMLAAPHELPWEPRRHAFGDPVSLTDELKRPDHLLDRQTLNPALVSNAPELRERLRATLPETQGSDVFTAIFSGPAYSTTVRNRSPLSIGSSHRSAPRYLISGGSVSSRIPGFFTTRDGTKSSDR
jgi:aminoglycoside phosphotransferase (APT) family kinase protein